ncbi:MAG: curli production assembly protein CsgG [Bryobacterales bacterium]|nr:curli production assembly protein CsgG [Bryobacterales bacterium]
MNRCCLGLICLVLTMLPLSAQERKRRVAVVNFDYSTVSNYVYSIFNTNVDIGKGVADLMVDQLVADGAYQVYERKAMEKILAEQNFSNSDRANPTSAARIGQLIGVDAIIMGSITQFGRDDKKTEIGAIGRVTGRYGISGIGKKESKAVVGISARIVNVDTGEVVVTASGNGESSRSGTALLGSGGGTSGSGGGYADMTSSNFAGTLIGEAVKKAVATTTKQLDASASRVPVRTIRLQGLVADFSNGAIIINIGSKAGVKVGDKFEIARAGREITDPATGRVFKRITDHLGEIVITQVDELSATGKFTGPGEPRVGDMARTPEN